MKVTYTQGKQYLQDILSSTIMETEEIGKKENIMVMDPTAPFSSSYSRSFMGCQFPN